MSSSHFQVPSSAMLVTAQAAAAQDKINRELFVGNTPPGTNELLLLHFFNAAMRRAGLCGPQETPVLSSRVNAKFAFVELVNSETANKALNLNGIPFLGANLKVSRPSKYSGPDIPAKTWYELTGQSQSEGNGFLDPEQEKMSRELFIGNTTPEMTESMIREFLGNAMQQVGLTVMPGNPINSCRVSGKFAFVELRTSEEAKHALNLNNIPFMGTALRVGRPSKWTGPPEQHGNWEDILAKYMAGELDVPDLSTTNQHSLSAPQQLGTSRVVRLENMLTHEDLANEEEYEDILDDTKEECSQFGQLISVIIPKADQNGATKVFLEYASQEDAAKAVEALEGRTFDGRRVQATYFDEERFQAKDYV